MSAEDPVTKEFVDREIRHLREKTDEKFVSAENLENQKFKSRDDAIKLLAEGVKNQRAVYLAIGLAGASLLLNLILKFLVK